MPVEEKLDINIAKPYLEIFLQDNQKKPVVVLPHYHDCYEILYMLYGTALQKVNEKSYYVKKNDLILIKPSDIHETVCQKREDVKILVIKFLPEFIESAYLKPSELKYITEFLNLHSEPVSHLMNENPVHEKLIAVMNETLSEFSEQKEGYELYLKGCLFQLVTQLFRADILKMPSGEKDSKLNDQILQLIRSIEENEEGVSLSDASKSLHLNYSYCSRYFKKATGKGFKQYIDYIKICKAEKLILTKDYNVTDAANAIGFSSVPAFTRTYKRMRGYLPGTLKKVKK